MDSAAMTSVMDGLLSGRLSRNRDFDFFKDPAARRAHVSLNRLLSLAEEFSLPGAVVDVSTADSGVAVNVRVDKLGYSRKAKLSGWECDYLFDRLGADLRL